MEKLIEQDGKPTIVTFADIYYFIFAKIGTTQRLVIADFNTFNPQAHESILRKYQHKDWRLAKIIPANQSDGILYDASEIYYEPQKSSTMQTEVLLIGTRFYKKNSVEFIKSYFEDFARKILKAYPQFHKIEVQEPIRSEQNKIAHSNFEFHFEQEPSFNIWVEIGIMLERNEFSIMP